MILVFVHLKEHTWRHFREHVSTFAFLPVWQASDGLEDESQDEEKEDKEEEHEDNKENTRQVTVKTCRWLVV